MKKLLKLLLKLAEYKAFFRNIFLLLIVTRLLFIEPNQLALIAEILGSLAVLMSKDDNDAVCD